MGSSVRQRSIAGFVVIFLASAVFAGRGTWTTSGPPGGAAVIAVDPHQPLTVYALGGGLFKSADGGQSWEAKTLFVSDPWCLAIAPSDPSILYIGSQTGQVVKSSDGGETWREADSGLPTPSLSLGRIIYVIAIDPTNAEIAYAGTYSDGVFKTLDGGKSWKSVGLPDQSRATAIAIDPRVPSTLFVSTQSDVGSPPEGVFKSTDAGTTWTLEATGRAAGSSLTIDPSDTRVIYETVNSDGVFKSLDGGSTWQQMNTGISETPGVYVGSLALDPLNPATIYIGLYGDQVFKSEDGGSHWSRVYSGDGLAFATVATGESEVFLGDATHLAKSTDGGAHWVTSDTGLFDSDIACVAVDANDTLYAGASASSLTKSSRPDRTWTQLEIPGLTEPTVRTIAIDPSNSAVLYAGVDGYGIYKSVDSGERWTQAEELFGGYTLAIAIDPLDSQNIYAATEVPPLGLDFDGASWVSRSSDGGMTWTSFGPANSIVADSLAIDSDNPSTLFAGGQIPGGMFRSTDSGDSWVALNTGLTGGGYLSSVVIDPHDSLTIYAALGFFTAPEFGILKSEDGGDHWVLRKQGLPDGPVTALAIDPVHSKVLYAGSYDQGVFRSDDAGETWRPINSGLLNPRVNALAFDSSGSRLFAGTAAGVYEMSPLSITTLPPPNVAPISGRPGFRPSP